MGTGTERLVTVSDPVDTVVPAWSPGDTVRFQVYGRPYPQGSKRAFVVKGKAQLADSAGPAGARWRDAVVIAARKERDARGAALDGALEVAITFRFPMPANRPKYVRSQIICPKATAPDLSKLVRAVEDGMEAAGLIINDARIARWIVDKVEVFDTWAGAEICVRPMQFGTGLLEAR